MSTERIVAGPAIVAIYETLAEIERQAGAAPSTTRRSGNSAFEGEDSLAVAALDRFCLSLGAFAGDLALTQGRRAL